MCATDYDAPSQTECGELSEAAAVTAFPIPPEFAHQAEVLGPLVRVLEEAAADEPWAVIGASACQLQGVEAVSPNLEVMTSEAALRSLAEMLGLDASWQRGTRLAAERLHFMRDGVPVFIFANPTFHGSYDALSPADIPSLWDARVRIELDSVTVIVTPLEWELLLAVVLSARDRADALVAALADRPADGRLMTRLLREGHVEPATEELVWAAIEDDNGR
jgi:hypothetical protein